jgi:phosphoribosyl-dephospho-CoA transferase
MLSLPSLPETHDLLRLSSLELEQAGVVKPEWVDAALKASPWVVVRRASTNGNLVPVGVPGKERAQRWAGFVNPEQIAQIVPPNQCGSPWPKSQGAAFGLSTPFAFLR